MAKRSVAKRHPVQQQVPADQRQHEDHAIGNRGVLTRHCILRSISDDYQYQDIGYTNRTDIAPYDKTEHKKQESVAGRPTHDDLHERRAQTEHRSQIKSCPCADHHGTGPETLSIEQATVASRHAQRGIRRIRGLATFDQAEALAGMLVLLQPVIQGL